MNHCQSGRKLCCGEHELVIAHVGNSHGVVQRVGAEVALTVEAILGLGVPLVERKVRLVAGLQAQVDLVDGGVHR